MTLRILYQGNYRNLASDGRSYNTEAHIARDLEALGHEVTLYQESPSPNADGIRRLERAVDGHDLFLWTRTWGMIPEATKLWRRMEARGTVTASLHLDLYRGLQRERLMARDPFWTTQWVFTPDGNPESQAFFEANGINHVWSPPGVVRDECADMMPGRYRSEFATDVAFVGSLHYHHEWPHRVELIQWLERTYRGRFVRHGGDLPGGPTRGQALNDLYASAGIVVGDTLSLPGNTHYSSDRFAETLGRGGALIYHHLPMLDELGFREGEHMRYYTPFDWHGLREQIDKALADPDETRAMAMRGSAFVAANHTYRNRLAVALETMGFA